MSVNLGTFDFLKLKIHIQVIHLYSKNYIQINTGIFIEKIHTHKKLIKCNVTYRCELEVVQAVVVKDEPPPLPILYSSTWKVLVNI